MRHPLEHFKISYGLNSDQLSKAFGVGSATISRWLKDIGSPTQKDISKLNETYSLSQVMELVHRYLKWYEAQRKNGNT